MTLTPVTRRCRRCGAEARAAGARAELRPDVAEAAEPARFCGPCSEDLGSEAARAEYLRLALLA